MGRAPRLIDPALHYHVIVRCNNGAFLLESEKDFQTYLSLLHLAQKKHLITIFNYELMNSHVHLFLQP
jgi:REP element-mobilizing transposase RayT